MPNWCNNTVTFVGEKEDIQKFAAFLEEKEGKEWFDYFYPCPKELYENDEWYGWCVENWGTKWNCDANDWSISDDGTELSFWFDSAWGPPIGLYEFVEEYTKLQVNAYYHEEGMQFVGEFVDGDDESYEYTDLDSLDDIPESIVEHWNLREMFEERENDELE